LEEFHQVKSATALIKRRKPAGQGSARPWYGQQGKWALRDICLKWYDAPGA